jgi:hypothetical protein
MTIAIGKVGKGSANDTNTVTANWTGGGTNTAGSTLLALLSSSLQSTISPTTPTGWTLRASNSGTNGGSIYVYELVNASAIFGLTVNYTSGGSSPVVLDIMEFTGAASLDSSTSIANGTGTTTLTTNAITTVAANTVLVALFEARAATATPRNLSTPSSGFTQVQSDNEDNDGTTSITNYAIYKIVSSVQSNVSATCNSNATTSFQCILLAYVQAVPAVTPAPRKRKRLFRRIARRAGKGRLGVAALALAIVFPFGRRRRRIRRLRALGRRRRGFYGDITPIAPRGQCFTITVSEELGATLAVFEELAGQAGEVERLSASGSTAERLSATGLVRARLGSTVTIVCCH